MDRLLDFFASLAPGVSYAVLAAGAAAENLFPPVPADTVVLLGGFLAGRGLLRPVPIFLVTWLANVVGAYGIYWAGVHLGRPFFQTGLGRHLLDRRHLEQLASFHARWGTWAVFLSRFLPGFRALVPVFAGVGHMSPWKVIPPMVLASGLWYGFLVAVGYKAGENLDRILEVLSHVNTGLLAVSALLAVGLGVWWFLRRRWHAAEEENGPGTVAKPGEGSAAPPGGGGKE